MLIPGDGVVVVVVLAAMLTKSLSLHRSPPPDSFSKRLMMMMGPDEVMPVRNLLLVRPPTDAPVLGEHDWVD